MARVRMFPVVMWFVVVVWCALALSIAVALGGCAPAFALDVSRGTVFAGDSVRFVARATVPAGMDSVTFQWALGTNPPQRHTLRPPFSSPASDTAKFALPAQSSGGSSATGTLTVRTWRGGVGSSGVVKSLEVVRAPLGPPPEVSGLVLADSAVVY